MTDVAKSMTASKLSRHGDTLDKVLEICKLWETYSDSRQGRCRTAEISMTSMNRAVLSGIQRSLSDTARTVEASDIARMVDSESVEIILDEMLMTEGWLAEVPGRS